MLRHRDNAAKKEWFRRKMNFFFGRFAAKKKGASGALVRD
jgi:hypothetical protein